MLLTKERNTSLVNLASWSTTSTSGNPAPDRKHMSRMIAAASVAVAVERDGTACTLPDSRSTWFWIMSKPAAVVGSPAIQSTPIIPPRRDGSGRGWRSPRGPPCSTLCAGTSGTSARTLRRRRPSPPRGRHAAPATPSWLARSPCRAVVALAEHLHALPAAGGDAEPVRLALAAAIEEATTYQKLPPQGMFVRSSRGAPCRSTSVPKAAAPPRMIGLKSASSASSFDSAWTKDGERKRSSEGTGGDGAAVVPVPSGSSAPASAMNIPAPGGICPSPWGGCVWGIASNPRNICETSAARRSVAHRARTAASTTGAGASRPRGEKEFLLTLRVGFACRYRGVVAVGEATARQLIRRAACTGQVRPGASRRT